VQANKKDGMKAALLHRQPEWAVPLWELEFHIWNLFSDRKMVLGAEFVSLTAGEQERALHTNAEVMADVAEELCFSALTIPGNYWEVGPGTPTYYWLPPEARFRQTAILVEAVGAEVLLIAHTGGVMGMPGANDYVEFSYKLFDAPEEIDLLARRTLESGLESAKRFRDLGVEGMCSPSDIADNKGPFFSPEQMRRFILPYLGAWAREVRKLGAYSILHTDGNLYACMEDIAASGIDALQAIDPVAGMDIRKVKILAGQRLCLCGNIDCGVLLSGMPDDVYQATRDLLLDCKPGGGLVLGVSNAVQQEVSRANYCAVIEAWKEHGRYSNEEKTACS
jgi:uroporphyrinogen decarboxylase